MSQTIYTIGHSNHPIAVFIAMLQSFGIQVLADVRSFPGSKWNPQYNRQVFSQSLKEVGIQYIHLPGLGGKQNNNSIGGYAGYMQTNIFKQAIQELEAIAVQQNTAYMCAEALWTNCHRSYISDYLKAAGWQVQHIADIGKSTPHTHRPPALPKQGNLFT